MKKGKENYLVFSSTLGTGLVFKVSSHAVRSFRLLSSPLKVALCRLSLILAFLVSHLFKKSALYVDPTFDRSTAFLFLLVSPADSTEWHIWHLLSTNTFCPAGD